MSPWADGLGRAGARAVQLLAITAVAAMALYALLALRVVVLAVLIALILACAVRPLVVWLTRHGWGGTGAAVTVFGGLLGVMGGIVTGAVLGVRGQLDDLVTASTTGWEHLQELLAAGPLPVDASTVNAALAQLRDYLASAGARQSALSGVTVASEVLTGTVLMVVVLIVVVVNLLEGYFLHPVVLGHTLRLHGLVVLLALAAGSVLAGVAGAVLAVPLTAVAWSVLQVWTTRYQSGLDPVLGPDPVSPKESTADRVSRLNRRRYQRMRGPARSAPWAVHPPSRMPSQTRSSP
ncbi:AI-2E family transporter [Kocuria oceani]|uniref:AI-2E family transporter n=1 Tax=Kocuria oceani TaxID=988827 RepID=A0ABV9TNN2_9MICC|nr:AI-2E family transporter [Kocuria oceani]